LSLQCGFYYRSPRVLVTGAPGGIGPPSRLLSRLLCAPCTELYSPIKKISLPHHPLLLRQFRRGVFFRERFGWYPIFCFPLRSPYIFPLCVLRVRSLPIVGTFFISLFPETAPFFPLSFSISCARPSCPSADRYLADLPFFSPSPCRYFPKFAPPIVSSQVKPPFFPLIRLPIRFNQERFLPRLLQRKDCSRRRTAKKLFLISPSFFATSGCEPDYLCWK